MWQIFRTVIITPYALLQLRFNFDSTSNDSRTAVESQSNRSCNRRLTNVLIIIIIIITVPAKYLCGSVAEWLGSRTCDQQIAGSNPSPRATECNPGQVVYTHMYLCHQAV